MWITSIVFPPATAKYTPGHICASTYLLSVRHARKKYSRHYFCILPCTRLQKIVYEFFTWYIQKFCPITQKIKWLWFHWKKWRKYFFCYFLAVQYLFTKDSCALICCNFAFARVKLVKIKKMLLLYTPMNRVVRNYMLSLFLFWCTVLRNFYECLLDTNAGVVCTLISAERMLEKDLERRLSEFSNHLNIICPMI